MVGVSSVRGKWTQAFVEANFRKGASSGYFRVFLKDLAGKKLYSNKVFNENWWDEASFYRPKWGLYRKINCSTGFYLQDDRKISKISNLEKKFLEDAWIFFTAVDSFTIFIEEFSQFLDVSSTKINFIP